MANPNRSQRKNPPAKNKPGSGARLFWTPRNIVIVVLAVIIVSGLVYNFFLRRSEPRFVKQGEVIFMHSGTKSEIKKIDVEVAATPAAQTQGLMFRSHMDDSQGMLFIFPVSEKHAFWMKNTLIPLDIIFIDSQGQIDTVYRNTVPLSERSLPSRRNVQFVVEVNGGFCDKYGIKERDLISYQVMNNK
jgi:uncharacterized membrane protein (UPF0127 family)